MYGESFDPLSRQRAGRGLSPRVRGIPALASRPGAPAGSIPACTGNPWPRCARRRRPRVYPRVYGESVGLGCDGCAHGGLSPRVRGIHGETYRVRAWSGSIPACTGNPRRRPTSWTPRRVYPRVYGESKDWRFLMEERMGLSPRVRGIQGLALLDGRAHGSIPACTGNPMTRPPRPPASEVYPRVYGESAVLGEHGGAGRGLSPRVRGIPRETPLIELLPWSIPACTGNPTPGGRRFRSSGVYPRVYGESSAPCQAGQDRPGLSPRVRGILLGHRTAGRCAGSIPACTGNPPSGAQCDSRGRVYPRVYGESGGLHTGRPVMLGLSPRVRGIPGGSPTW